VTASSDPPVETERTPERRTVEAFYEALAYARERDYVGWDYSDGLSSRLLQALPIEGKWTNLAVQEVIKRAPVNLRPLFLVEQRRNPMGAALFAMANLTAGELTGESRYAREARRLLDWLVDNRVEAASGFAVGYPHATQGLSKRTEPWVPGIVGTSYAVLALLRAGASDRAVVADRADDYAEVARTAARFVLEDLDYAPTDVGARINYKVTDSGEHYTLNANALGARTLLELSDRFDDPTLRDRATAILDYVASRQTEAGGWQYRDPPEASHLSMDNHHNGFVIEAFQRYADVIDAERFDDTIERGLAFYRTLFEDDGAPRFDEESAYPQDIHASTQGILVFSYAEEFERVRRIVGWTLAHLHAEDGAFYYRKYRYHTKRVVLMRWCQAWMAYSTTEFLRRRHLNRDEV